MKKKILTAVSALAVSSALAAAGINAAAQSPDVSVQPNADPTPQPSVSTTAEAVQASEVKTVQVPKIKVKAKKWDEEKLKELFISPNDTFELRVHDSTMFDGSEYYVYDGVKESGDEFWLVYEPGRLTAEYRNNSKGQLHLRSTIQVYNFGDFFGDKDLALFTREDAKNMVKPVFEELGITNVGEPEIHAFSAENANKYLAQDGYGAKGELEFTYPEWTEEDEMYILRYPLMYNGLPASTEDSNSFTLGGKHAPMLGNYIDVIVTKDRILSIEGLNILSSDYEEAEDVAINCDYETALKKGNEYFEDWTGEFNSCGYMGTYNFEIENCQLVYVPLFDNADYAKYFSAEEGFALTEDVDFTLVPMWRVDAAIDHSEESFSGRRTLEIVFIDPQTGDIM